MIKADSQRRKTGRTTFPICSPPCSSLVPAVVRKALTLVPTYARARTHTHTLSAKLDAPSLHAKPSNSDAGPDLERLLATATKLAA
jgi:hypothetical protein